MTIVSWLRDRWQRRELAVKTDGLRAGLAKRGVDSSHLTAGELQAIALEAAAHLDEAVRRASGGREDR